jgi:murein DD-endopeptidase MepM/ murein hydrolase activator NlpD
MVLVLLVGCQSATPSPTFSVEPATNTVAQTQIPPTLAPTEIPTSPSVDLAWPTYVAPTLAPFPLSENEMIPVVPIIPANFSAPVALTPQDHLYFSLPVEERDINNSMPSQRYGTVQEGTEADAHLGLDLSINTGTPVLAAAPGTVVWASYGLLFNSEFYIDDPYGISVVIRHDFGYDGKRLFTIYAHLSEANVEVGEYVERGEVIARSGSTGQSTGPHLHFEVRLGTNTIYFTRNPELWIASEDRGVLAGRITTSRDALLFNKLVEITSRETGQRWTMYTYATEFRLLPDDYYDENFVLSDLPEGTYEIAIPYLGVWQRVDVEIRPGMVTYFDFRGTNGYDFDPPAIPALGFVPGP